jgi:processive 1,2-diacylglycerol beta-glucosyltransferase
MSTHPSILLFHCPAGGGHKAAALAVAEAAAARGRDAEVVDALELTPPWFARAYVGAHLTGSERAPALYGHAYQALDQRVPLADGVRGVFDRALGAGVKRLVAARAPLAVVATHFFPMEVLGHERVRGRLATPVVGVVTDHRAHAFWAERGVDRFCTAAGRPARDLVRHGVPADAVVATGIPVRAAFGAVRPLEVPRAGEPLRVLVTSGGFGVGPVVDVVRSFAGLPHVELVVVCGANAARVADVSRAVSGAGVAARVIGFEPDMPARMAEAHVVIGKPGGLTVSEAMAAGRPMVLVGTCPGQEASNERWLLTNGAAVVASARDAGRAALALHAGGRLAALAAAAREIASPDAAARVVDVALHLAGVRADEALGTRAAAAA